MSYDAATNGNFNSLAAVCAVLFFYEAVGADSDSSHSHWFADYLSGFGIANFGSANSVACQSLSP